MKVEQLPLKVSANPDSVTLRFTKKETSEHYQKLVNRFFELSDDQVERLWWKIHTSFSSRHRYFEDKLTRNYRQLEVYLGRPLRLESHHRLLLGAYLSEEYATEAVGIVNPSIVSHPDQEGLQPGELRVLLSIQSIGEGNFSSLSFRQGIINKDGDLQWDDNHPFRSPVGRDGRSYSHDFLRSRLPFGANFDPGVIRLLPDPFTLEDAFALVESPFRETLLQLIDDNYNLRFEEGIPLSERLLLPQANSEGTGIVDVRWVQMQEEDCPRYLGTYTACEGSFTQSKLIRTHDFLHFTLGSFYGKGIAPKGMAFFPKRIDGKFAILSPFPDSSLGISFSTDLFQWKERHRIATSFPTWALVEAGNCGSPLETEAGWLLLTYGIGPLQQYSLGVSLLDRKDPVKMIGSLRDPLLTLSEQARNGYQPNRLFSSGWLQHLDNLIIPYSTADASVNFLRVKMDDLLAELV